MCIATSRWSKKLNPSESFSKVWVLCSRPHPHSAEVPAPTSTHAPTPTSPAPQKTAGCAPRGRKASPKQLQPLLCLQISKCVLRLRYCNAPLSPQDSVYVTLNLLSIISLSGKPFQYYVKIIPPKCKEKDVIVSTLTPKKSPL